MLASKHLKLLCDATGCAAPDRADVETSGQYEAGEP